MDKIIWTADPLNEEAKRTGMKPFSFRAKLGHLTLRAYQYFSGTWEASIYNESLGLDIGGTFQFPLKKLQCKNEQETKETAEKMAIIFLKEK
jgi:hypothetical protein